MNTFDVIAESIINIPRNCLDTTVFQFSDSGLPPILNDGIRAQILRDIEVFKGIVQIVRFFATGEVLTPNYTNSSELCVNIQVDAEDIDAISTAELMSLLKKINGKLAVGTTHPINYYIIMDDYDIDSNEAAYDIINERWIKTSPAISPVIEEYFTLLQQTLQTIDITDGQIKRNVFDIEEFSQQKIFIIEKFIALLKFKYKETEEKARQMSKLYRTIDNKPQTIEDIVDYGRVLKLPEAFIMKLLQKYYYGKLITKLEKILNDRKNPTFRQMPGVQDLLKGQNG